MKWTKTMVINRIKGESVKKEEDILVIEYPLAIMVNDIEIITILCSPIDLKELGIGFLFSEGFLDNLDEIMSVDLDEEKGVLNVKSKNEKALMDKLKLNRTITSGSAKGTMFHDVMDSFKSRKIIESLEIKIEDIKSLVIEADQKSKVFLATGGVHSSALCSGNRMIFFAEDIGRHNALDKILGMAILKELDFKDKFVITSGRVSSEMLIKVAKRGIPLIVSKSAPTSLAIELARELNIGVVGFARGEKMNIYSSFSSFKG